MKTKFALLLIFIVLLSTLFVKADIVTIVGAPICTHDNVTDCAGEDWDRETCVTHWSDNTTTTTIRYYLYSYECWICMLQPVEGCF